MTEPKQPDHLTNTETSMMTAHSRHSVGLTYVYPVISRRAGGLSIGINLNTNSACNWRCLYCQVPNLTRGKPEPIDLTKLENELTGFLNEILQGDFMTRFVPQNARILKDIAFSGNGEPTAAPEFEQAIELIARLKTSHPALATLPVRLITNGSFMLKESVLRAVARLKQCNGEVWFKVDAVTKEDQQRINGMSQPADTLLARLEACSQRCPTWLQSCFFKETQQLPDQHRIATYIDFCKKAKKLGVEGVHLYTIARQPMQPGSEQLTPLHADELNVIAELIRTTDLTVTVSG